MRAHRTAGNPPAGWRRVLGIARPHAALVWGLGVFLGLSILVPGWREPFELRALNGAFLVRGPREPETPIVIIAIDESSFDELDLTWPWPRQLHGQLLDFLRGAGAAVVGMDVLFSEPSPWGPEDDEALSRAVAAAGNVVLAAAITISR